jgi:hypothetical protein
MKERTVSVALCDGVGVPTIAPRNELEIAEPVRGGAEPAMLLGQVATVPRTPGRMTVRHDVRGNVGVTSEQAPTIARAADRHPARHGRVDADVTFARGARVRTSTAPRPVLFSAESWRSRQTPRARRRRPRS